MTGEVYPLGPEDRFEAPTPRQLEETAALFSRAVELARATAEQYGHSNDGSMYFSYLDTTQGLATLAQDRPTVEIFPAELLETEDTRSMMIAIIEDTTESADDEDEEGSQVMFYTMTFRKQSGGLLSVSRAEIHTSEHKPNVDAEELQEILEIDEENRPSEAAETFFNILAARAYIDAKVDEATDRLEEEILTQFTYNICSASELTELNKTLAQLSPYIPQSARIIEAIRRALTEN